jgi:hypothetical protein
VVVVVNAGEREIEIEIDRENGRQWGWGLRFFFLQKFPTTANISIYNKLEQVDKK